jgi:hypothetical protein
MSAQDPTSTHDSVTAMAAAYAGKAVETARAMSARLDYSESSIVELETLLERLAAEMPGSNSAADDLTEACKVWGCYLGEVVRRIFGGEWSVETYPGKHFATLTLTVKGSKLFPSMKVHRRLTEGEQENVWTFFKMVKARLEAAPKVQ